ncbi:MAG: hypothetical protein HYZ24_03245 [Chloroflexi bacterium]|nr:hypothetical protein [Chloroflexota bacterium]
MSHFINPAVLTSRYFPSESVYLFRQLARGVPNGLRKPRMLSAGYLCVPRQDFGRLNHLLDNRAGVDSAWEQKKPEARKFST